jgi:hypothetical protein
MVNIRAAQQNIISEYASTCMTEIATCYNQQVSQVNAWSTSASVSSIYKVMTGACRNVALTCAYAVFDNDTGSCPGTGAGAGDDKCIQNISEMFYQSMLCPDNSTFNQKACNGGSTDCVGNNKQWVNKHCECNSGYVAYGSTCLPECGEAGGVPLLYSSTGVCVCTSGDLKGSQPKGNSCKNTATASESVGG